MIRFYSIAFVVMLLFGCENRALQDSEEFRPREIHTDRQFHFDRIEVDGVEYLILEKDNNNPHEGFGFMALRANKIVEKQDTILAYLNTIMAMQIDIYSKLYQTDKTVVKAYQDELFDTFLEGRSGRLKTLEGTYQSSTMLLPDTSVVNFYRQ